MSARVWFYMIYNYLYRIKIYDRAKTEIFQNRRPMFRPIYEVYIFVTNNKFILLSRRAKEKSKTDTIINLRTDDGLAQSFVGRSE